MDGDLSSAAFMPLEESVLSKLSPADRYLVSFPRSGRTWITLAFSMLVRLSLPAGHPDRPENWHQGKRKNIWGPINLHTQNGEWENPFSKEGQTLYLLTHSWEGLHPAAIGPHLYLFRRPEDVLVSYYHYSSSLGYLDKEAISLADFARGNLPWWVAHLKKALRRADEDPVHPSRWSFLSYETLCASPAERFHSLASLFGLEGSTTDCRLALDEVTPSKMSHIIPDFPLLNARPGRGASDLPKEVLEEIEFFAMPLYERALDCERRSFPGL